MCKFILNYLFFSESRRAPRLGQQRRQGRRVSFLDSQVRRFEEIESRRVEAEMTNAQAQMEKAQSLSQLAAAVTQSTAAITQSGELIAAAIRYLGDCIAATAGRPDHSHD